MLRYLLAWQKLVHPGGREVLNNETEHPLVFRGCQSSEPQFAFCLKNSFTKDSHKIQMFVGLAYCFLRKDSNDEVGSATYHHFFQAVLAPRFFLNHQTRPTGPRCQPGLHALPRTHRRSITYKIIITWSHLPKGALCYIKAPVVCQPAW